LIAFKPIKLGFVIGFSLPKQSIPVVFLRSTSTEARMSPSRGVDEETANQQVVSDLLSEELLWRDETEQQRADSDHSLAAAAEKPFLTSLDCLGLPGFLAVLRNTGMRDSAAPKAPNCDRCTPE